MLTNEQQHQPITGHGSCCLHGAKTIISGLLLAARCLWKVVRSGHKPHQQSWHVPVRASISNSPRATTAILATGGGLSIELLLLYCLQSSFYLLAVRRLEFVWVVFFFFVIFCIWFVCVVCVLDIWYAGNFLYLCLQKLLPKIICTKINKLAFKRQVTVRTYVYMYEGGPIGTLLLAYCPIIVYYIHPNRTRSFGNGKILGFGREAAVKSKKRWIFSFDCDSQKLVQWVSRWSHVRSWRFTPKCPKNSYHVEWQDKSPQPCIDRALIESARDSWDNRKLKGMRERDAHSGQEAQPWDHFTAMFEAV